MPIITGTANGETLNGTPDADSIYGLGGDDSLFGFAGSDLLDGGAGRDSMQGGAGDDTYVVNDSLDAIIESSGQGDDVVRSTVSYTLGAAVSIETMTTLNAASTAGLNFTGNEFGQSIYGNAGANILNGGGGADFLVGLSGNDRYIVDNASDVIGEAAGEGDDIVFSSVSYVLAQGVSIETLTTTNQAATDPINFTGNDLGNSIYGNAGANTLNGGGGSDYLVGMGGNDHYIFQMPFDLESSQLFLDTIVEAADGGDDSVHSGWTYILPRGLSIETITTINADDTIGIALLGNELAQSIYGNAGANAMAGGAGDDYLVGLGGDDILNGGPGANRLFGGDGSDMFEFSHLGTGNVIVDFTSGVDTIALGEFIALLPFTFLGDADFTGIAGEGRYANGVFEIDTNGDTRADFAVSLTGPLVEEDFFFGGEYGGSGLGFEWFLP